MNGNKGQTVWDPLRKKEVALTPEEQVRQWFIGQLSGRMEVPLHMMMSEVTINLGRKTLRADIVVWDRTMAPLAVVECKRPEVELDSKVLSQAVSYNMVLNVRYIIITNGTRTYIFRRTSQPSDTNAELTGAAGHTNAAELSAAAGHAAANSGTAAGHTDAAELTPAAGHAAANSGTAAGHTDVADSGTAAEHTAAAGHSGAAVRYEPMTQAPTYNEMTDQ